MHRIGGLPALSVILPTANDFAGIRLTVNALHAQTVRDRIELVIVAPDDSISIPESEVHGFARLVVVKGGPLETSNGFRVKGIRAATSPVVAMAEDHCFPDPDWAESLLAAHDGECAVVGPVLRNANPHSMISWANFVLEYGPWFEGAAHGEVVELPGHNSSYRRDLLLEYGDQLDQLFEVESVVQRSLRENGFRFLLEPRAATNHLNFSRVGPTVSLRINAGRSYAGYRIIGWSVARRAMYAAASPLIPFVRGARIIRFLTGSTSFHFLLPRILPALFFALIIDGFGEMLGYILGPGNSPRRLGAIEFDRMRFMSRADCENLSRRIAALDQAEELAAMAV